MVSAKVATVTRFYWNQGVQSGLGKQKWVICLFMAFVDNSAPFQVSS